MALTVLQSQYPNWGIGGTEIFAAANRTASVTGTTYAYGKGLYLMQVVVSALEIATNDELYAIQFEANSVASSSTWKVIGRLTLGCLEKNAAGTDDIVGTYNVYVYNESDNAVRVNLIMSGTTTDSTGINMVVTALPVATRNS